MSMKTLETAIRNELRVILHNPKLKTDDIMEWSTSEEAVKKSVEKDEVVVRGSMYWAAVKKKDDKRPAESVLSVATEGGAK